MTCLLVVVLVAIASVVHSQSTTSIISTTRPTTVTTTVPIPTTTTTPPTNSTTTTTTATTSTTTTTTTIQPTNTTITTTQESTTSTTEATVVNCAGCGVAGNAPGSATWCRCCSTQPECFAMDRPNVYIQASCIADEGFCVGTCLDQDARICANVVLPNTTSTVTTTSTTVTISSTESSSSVLSSTTTSTTEESTTTTAEAASSVSSSCDTVALGTPCTTDEGAGGRCVAKLTTGCLPVACVSGTEFCAAQPAGFSVWVVGDCVNSGANGARSCVIPEESIDTCLLKAVGEPCSRAAGTTTEPGVCLRNDAGQVKCVPTLECQKEGDMCTLNAGGLGECKLEDGRIQCAVSGLACYEQGAACTIEGTDQQGRCEPDGDHGLFCSALKHCSAEGDRCTAADATAVTTLVDGTCVRVGTSLMCEPNWYATSACVPGRQCRTIGDREGKCYRVANKCPRGLVCAQVLRHVCLSEVCIVKDDNCRLGSGDRGLCSSQLECVDPASLLLVNSATRATFSVVALVAGVVVLLLRQE
jgi:hypothetical protein